MATPEGPKQSTFLMGLLETLLGFLTITLYAGIIVVQAPFYISGIGVWGGAIYLFAGVMAMFAFQKKTHRFCMWALVLNVFVLLIAAAFFAIACAAINQLRLDLFDYEILDSDAILQINQKCHSITFSRVQLNPYYCREKVIEYTRIGMILYVLLMLVSVIEFVAGCVIIYMCGKEMRRKDDKYRPPTAQTGQVNKVIEMDRSGAYPSSYPSA